MKVMFTTFFAVVALSVFGQFSGYFDPGNWTLAHSNGCDDGYVDASGAPASVTLVGSEVPGCGSSVVSYGISVEICGTVSFDWDYTTVDCNGSFYDRFGYYLNGNPVQLSVDCINCGFNQSGSVSIPVDAGDNVAFYMWSIDNICGRAWSVISNFSAPDAVCYGDDGEVKVELCHKGNSICVSPNAVAAHLAHGDQLGTCEELADCDGGAYQVAPETVDPADAEHGSMILNRNTVASFRPSVEQLMALSSDQEAINVVDVYPNPAKDVLNITANRGFEGPVSISIYNIAGQQVIQSNVDVTRGVPVQVNIKSLIEGNYNVRLESKQGFTQTEKFSVGGK
jgi:hypothetical protein